MVGAGTGAVAITPDGTKAYVTAPQLSAVIPIDLVTGVAGTPIVVGIDLDALVVTPDVATVSSPTTTLDTGPN